MGNHRKTIIAAFLVAAGLVTAACVSGDERNEAAEDAITTTAVQTSTSAVETETEAADADASGTAAEANNDDTATGEVDAAVTTMLNNLAVVYRDTEGVWPGFDPTEHPTVVAMRNGSTVTGAVAVNHPAPDALGNAELIDTGDAPFTAHYVTDLADPASLDKVQFFEFNSQQGGVDSFVMVADPSDSILAPTAPEFATTYIHEMFHRYQFANFNESLFQDFENYPYTKENLELAALEGRALTEALRAETDAARDEAAARFAAIRMARRAAAPEVGRLDDPQEISEGTARYVEHRVAAEDFGAAYHRGNVDSGEIPTDVSAQFGVKETFGFGRFYATGAAILDLLHRMEVPNYTDRVEANEAPATILADVLGVTEADVADLVAEAKTNYDPLNELTEQAEAGAAAAADEPPIFSDDSGADGEGDFGGGGEEIEITDEEIECLIERGVDLEDEGSTISDEDFAACIG